MNKVLNLLHKVKKTFTKEDSTENNKSLIIKNKKYINILGIIILAVFIFSMGIYIFKKNTIKDNEKFFSKALNKGEIEYYDGNYDKAVENYLEIYEKDKNPFWYGKIAEVYSVSGDLENSKKYIDLTKEEREKFKSHKNITEVERKDKDILNLIVFNTFMNKDYKEAMNLGKGYLNKYKDNKELIKTMYTVYMVNGEENNAKELLKTYPLDDKSAYDKAEYARLLMLVNEEESAFRNLKEAWYLDKEEYKTYDIIAQMSVYNRDILIEKISKLIEKEPEELSYKLWLAKIYSINNETIVNAMDILEKIKDRDIGKLQVNIMRANMLYVMEKKEEADNIIKGIVEDNGEDYRVLHAAGWYYFNKGDYKEALNYCLKSIEKNKEYPDNYGFLMPEILKAMKTPEKGEPYFRTALYVEPYNYNMLLNLADVYFNTTKDNERALEYFSLASFIKPRDGNIKYNMAMVNIEKGNKEEAEKLLKECIKIDETSPKYQRTIGTLYMLNGNTEDGIKATRNAYEIDKSDILNLNNAGCYYLNFTEDLERGVYNIKKAYEGISDNTDDYTKRVIKENYDKAEKFLNEYKESKGGEKIVLPDFELFY